MHFNATSFSRRSVLRALTIPLATTLALGLGACSPQDSASKPVAGSIKPEQSY
ncbi:MAG: hypothetical protein HXX19_06540, partial [Rhodoferax sp.]|nr:hypothetical protein [Rhodoferax sp.]